MMHTDTDPPHDEAIADQRRAVGMIGADSQHTQDDDSDEHHQSEWSEQADESAMLLTALTRMAAVENAVPAFDPPTERGIEIEQRLMEASASRITELELRLQREWEALRQRHEEPIRELEARGAELSKTYADATRAAHAFLRHARQELIAFEETISNQIAEAARDLRREAAALRASTEGIASGEVNRAESTAPEPVSPTLLWRRLAPLIGGLLCVLVALLLFSVYLYGRVGAVDRLAAVAARESQDVRQVLTTETGLVQDARQIAADAASAAKTAGLTVNVLAAADLQRFELRGHTAPEAGGHALWSPSRGLVLTVTRLPPVPPGRVGQAWLVTSDGSVSLGLVSPDDQGRLTAAFDPPPAFDGRPIGFMVTLEPASGSATPSRIVLLAS
jgi:hypothetical protein